jgi:hypothetical protein
MVVRADDDGVVESYPLVKMLGFGSDAYRVLQAKGLIEEINEDQVIVITDWYEHNKIRADRKVNSVYLPLLRERHPELPIVEPKPRVDVRDNSRRTGHGQSTVSVSKVKLSKVKVSKHNKIKDNTTKLIAASGEGKIVNDYIDLFKTVNPSWERLFPQKGQRDAMKRMLKQHGEEKIKFIMEQIPKVNATKYAPTITTPCELERNLGKLIAFYQKMKNGDKERKIISI